MQPLHGDRAVRLARGDGSRPISRAFSATGRSGSAIRRRTRFRTTSTAAWCSPRRRCSSTSGCPRWVTRRCSACSEASASARSFAPSNPTRACGNIGRARARTPIRPRCAGRPAIGSPASRAGCNIADRAKYWATHARALRERILKKGWDEKRGALTGAFGSPDLDASVLLVAELGLLSPSDPRFVRTCDAIGRELMRNGRIMRYTAPDDFGAPETAFLACNFWYIDALEADRRARTKRGSGSNRFWRAATAYGLALGGHSPRDGRTMGKSAADLLHGGHHQHGDAAVVELGGGMGARLIIVSNRVAVPETPRAPLAGGMAVAVKAALKNRNGMWFGWSGKVAEEGNGEPHAVDVNKITYVLIDLSQERHPGILQRPRQQRAVADPPLPGRSPGIFARRRERLHAG